MDVEKVREYCLNKKGVTESFPFDETTLVFKVMDKMFALLNLDDNPGLGLKCMPDLATDLREKYSCVIPGYHLNKKHWNTIILDNSVKDELIYQWINISYNLVKKNLTIKKKNELSKL
ncbi:MAG: MmcQ/YjbR family DNA-binding protein [Bacteroidales bacterium]|nr:MmcQ/YjbR family DNA-binding protein [Bacteroidales bacterium]